VIISRPRYDEPYVPKNKDTIKHFLWFDTYFEEENKPAQAHFMLVDHVLSKHRKKVLECHRGLGKSTKIIHLILEWLQLGKKPNFGDFEYILIIQDVVSMVQATIETIASMIESSKLSEVLEIRKKRLDDDPTLYIYNKEVNKMFYIKGRGSGQSMRGTKIMNKRPNIVILDDIENETKQQTKEARNKLKNWFYDVVTPAINPNRFEFIFIGTPIHEDSLLLELVNSDQWVTLQLPVAEEFPPDDWNNLVTSWEDRFTKEYVRSVYEDLKDKGRERSFYQEYMLEVTPKDDLLFNLDNINYYNIDDIKDKLRKMNYYISVDLAVSEKSYADYTAISVVGIDSNRNWYLVDGFFGRIKPDKTIDKIFEFVDRWNPSAVVLEKVAFQLSMKTFIYNEMNRRGKYFNLQMVSRTKAKLSVIKALQPIVELGKLWLPKTHIKDFVNELKHEMELITNESILAKHDDLVDSISQLTLIDISYNEPIDYDSDLSFYQNYNNPYVF